MYRRTRASIDGISIFSLVAFCAMIGLGIACDSSGGSKGGGKTSSTGTKAPSETSNDDEDAAAGDQPLYGKGKITGRITVAGAKGNGRPLPMTGDQYCTTYDKKFVPPKDQVGADGGLPHTFVFIKKGLKNKYPVPEDAAVLDQSKCMYEPHILGMQVNQVLRIKNSDNTAHNVHAQPNRNEKFNIAQPTKGIVTEKTFKRPEVMVKFKCDVHGWMSAYVGVVKHPFFTVTDADGNFEIDQLPPGTYTLETWHEMYGERDVKVTIADDASENVNIEYARKN